MNKGKLYLIPSNISEVNANAFLPLEVITTVSGLTHFIAEREKTARSFLKLVNPDINQPQLEFSILNKHTKSNELNQMLDPCREGVDIGLLSEAGCPGVADPGSDIVAIAHKRGVQVIPLIGPSSILLALMASGLNGQSFSFKGYLAIDDVQKKRQIQFFEDLAVKKNETQIFIETPYRNDKLLKDLLKSLSSSTRLCIAKGIGGTDENIITKTVADWKKELPMIGKVPTVFLFGR